MFLVPEEMLLVPKVYSPIPNCLLHIINNDTGEELDTVFNQAATHVYQPNKVCGCYTALPFIFIMYLSPPNFPITMINRLILVMSLAFLNRKLYTNLF